MKLRCFASSSGRSAFFIFLCISWQATAQTTSSCDSSFRFYYYDQKLSMFETMPDQKNEIVWVGDSITDGGEWSELFPNATTLNRGISADNTFGILYRLHEITRRKPKKVFILIGINDIARGIPVDVILSNYKKIVTIIQNESPQTIVSIQSLLPTNNEFKDFPNHQNKTEQLLAVNEGLRKLSIAKRISYIDLYQPFLDESVKLDKRYTNDGLHLTGAGYQHWKEVLLAKKAL